MEKAFTQRGFGTYQFKDSYGEECSLQKSSSAMEDKIWFGIDDPNPRIMVLNAFRMGLTTEKTAGWMKYEIPKEVLISTRMHLNQEQVAELIPILQKFVETGEI